MGVLNFEIFTIRGVINHKPGMSANEKSFIDRNNYVEGFTPDNTTSSPWQNKLIREGEEKRCIQHVCMLNVGQYTTPESRSIVYNSTHNMNPQCVAQKEKVKAECATIKLEIDSVGDALRKLAVEQYKKSSFNISKFYR